MVRTAPVRAEGWLPKRAGDPTPAGAPQAGECWESRRRAGLKKSIMSRNMDKTSWLGDKGGERSPDDDAALMPHGKHLASRRRLCASILRQMGPSPLMPNTSDGMRSGYPTHAVTIRNSLTPEHGVANVPCVGPPPVIDGRDKRSTPLTLCWRRVPTINPRPRAFALPCAVRTSPLVRSGPFSGWVRFKEG